MIRAFAKPKKRKLTDEERRIFADQDIIVTKYEKKTEYNADGSYTVKRIPQKVNITKKVNETKKLIKKDKAQETLKELERIFTK